ncbi:MAG: peptide-methionine (S)-S-oxide reductase MsrA [Candidatus Hodarchaeales archaeon]
MHQELTEIITLGGGCFWCLEAIYKDVKGVIKVESGYSGGSKINPTYEEVCTGNTGHAEVVQISFNPQIISFEKILENFFSIHDPTQLNRQGADIGTQYRSVIFYHTERQRKIAEVEINKLIEAQIWQNDIVTKITPIQEFYRAEEYHQDYYSKNPYQRNPYQRYCLMVIAPKIVKFRLKNEDILKS